MNADVLTTRVADGIAVVTLGSARRIYFDAEMGDALTEALDGFAGDASVRVVVVTGGAPGYFIRHFTVAALMHILLGEPLTPREAERKSLVHETVSGKALDRATEIAHRLSSYTPASIAYIKRLVRNA